jgi:hypothetical protein
VEITLRKGGGYAGVGTETAQIDAERLPDADRARLRERLEGSGFFGLPAEAPGAIGADLPRYELTVRDGDRTHTVAWSDDGGPETAPLREIAEHVERLA